MKIQYIREGFEPFLPVGEYEVIKFYESEPVIIDNTGHELRLDKLEDYKIINK